MQNKQVISTLEDVLTLLCSLTGKQEVFNLPQIQKSVTKLARLKAQLEKDEKENNV